MIVLRPMLPKWYRVELPTTVTGRAATAPDGQLPPGRGSQTRFGNHCTPLLPTTAVLTICTGAPTSGRSVAEPVSELEFAAPAPPVIAAAFPASKVTGLPL